MKTAKPIMMLLLLVATVLLLIGSCKKSVETNDTDLHRKSGGSIPTFTTANELNEHLRWIARGLANWQKPFTLVRQIDSVLHIASNDSNEYPITYLNGLYSFGSALDDSIDTRFPSNNYDPDGLGGFSMSSRTYYTKIYAPNSFYSLSKPFVVVPVETPTDSLHPTSVKGYMPKIFGGIDSVTITDLNEDDYYIWVVDYYHPSEYPDLWESAGGDSLQRKSGRVLTCNGNGTCDPGEQYNPNCSDCHSIPPQKYKLVVTHIEVFRDNCPRASKFFDGKYEICVTYGLEDGQGTATDTGYINDYYWDEELTRLKRSDVCREKCPWGGSKGSCPSEVHYINHSLYEEIDPSDTNCKMPFIFFEYDYDPLKLNADTYMVHNYDLALGKGYTTTGYFDPYWWSWQAPYIATTVNLYDMWVQNSHNGSYIWLGNNEMKVRLELIKLP